MVLVTGFGPFLDVSDNPSAKLAREIDGRRVAGETIVSHVLPVSFDRGPDEVLRLMRVLGEPKLVLGLGVARSRPRVNVERVGRRACVPTPDVDGVVLEHLGDGPDEVRATIDVQKLAKALKADLSDDAGGYVCNAWLYRVTRGLPGVPVGFVHVPPSGLEPARLLAGIAALLG